MTQLVHAIAASGDRKAFTVLFEHFAPRVKGYLMRGGLPAAAAEELAQETMVVLWRKAATFTAAKGGVATWIFTIARNLRIDRHRQHPEVEHDAADLEDTSVDPAARPDDALDARQRENCVRHALCQLPAEQVCVIQLSYYAERPHERIAQELDLPLGTVKSRIRLAVRSLRRVLDMGEP